MKNILTIFALILLLSGNLAAQLPSGWKAHDLSRPKPVVVTPAPTDNPAAPPSDAVILFDGSTLDHWKTRDDKPAKWKIVDGAMESVPGSGFVTTKKEFSDCQLHVEFASPAKVKGNGQGRGNSGVFLMGDIEVQVLDSYQNDTYPDGSAGSIYGQYPPLVNASRKPGEWQSFDIIFRAPRFDKQGALTSPARITVFHNGVVIQDASEAYGPTSWIQHRKYAKGKTKGPISLQDHGNPVRYRNIWVRPLAKERARPEKQPPTPVVVAEEDLKKLAGKYGAIPVDFENGKLYLKFSGAKLEMVPVSKSEFVFTKSAGKVVFTLNDQGEGIDLKMTLDAAGTRNGKKK